jgi:nucleoside-diphosphate-sugar epimerase
MRVLVTGARGFTGRYLCAALCERGHEVLPIAADITDRDMVLVNLAKVKPDSIIHLAAIAFVGSDDFEMFYRVNQLGTFNLLEAAAVSTPGARVLLVSSANIYGNQTEGLIDETCLPNPVNHYALSKWAMELGARFWSGRLDMTVVRPFNYTGIGQGEQYLIPKIVAHFKRRAPSIELGNLDIRRDFGDVRSVVSAYCDLLDTPASIGETYNVSSGETYSLHEIIAIASRLTNHRIDVHINPAFVRANEVKVLAGNSAKLKAALPHWKPLPLSETLSRMLGVVDKG